MRRAWKIVLPVTCAVLIGGTMTFELVHRHHLEQQKLAQEAQGYRVRAEKGEAEAQYSLARMYFKGQGVPQSYTEAFRWYRKAADQNFAKAQYAVGYSYYHGYGVDGSFTEALHWFHLAADQKESRAETEIGIAYEVGNGVKPDLDEAVHWYRLGADHGEAAAECDLGLLYAYGYGVGRDRAEARKWITKSADQGYLKAKQMLGRSWPALSTVQKVPLVVELIGGILLIIPSLGPKLRSGSQIRRSTGFIGLGVLFSVALSLLSYAYAGVLAPPYVVWTLKFARSFVGGVIVSLLLRIVLRNSAKWSLWAAGILFVVLNGIIFVCCFNRLPTEAAIRLLISTNGMPIGLGITSIVLLRRAKRGGDTGGPDGRDVNVDDGVGEVTES